MCPLIESSCKSDGFYTNSGMQMHCNDDQCAVSKQMLKFFLNNYLKIKTIMHSKVYLVTLKYTFLNISNSYNSIPQDLAEI